MSESEISVEYEVCLPTQLAYIGATSRVKNKLNIIRVRYTTQNQKFALAYARLRSYVAFEHTQKLQQQFQFSHRWFKST